jgi:hypothetical protein
MAVGGVIVFDQPSAGVIPLHFDVPDHAIPLTTFIDTAVKVREIVGSFNRVLFDGGLEFEIYVLAAEEGSFKNRLFVVLLSGATMLFAFAETDMGKAFVEGLTGEKPEHYFREAGKYLRRSAIDVNTKSLSAEDAPLRDGGTAILVETTKSFMQKDVRELRKIGIDEKRFRDAFEARNEFYQSCHANPQVRAIGFNEEASFPIKRQDFLRLQTTLAPREEPIEQLHWDVEIVTLRVTSPNWDREDVQRSWKGKDSRERERYFTVEDEHFWSLVAAHKINPAIVDTMKTQWAVPKGKRRTGRVLKVIEYNDVVLGEPLDENALRSILGLLDTPARSDRDLFDS